MKKFLFFLLLVCISSNVRADNDWKDYWIKAVEYCDKDEYILAKDMFDLAIYHIEKDGIIDSPYVYIDRAQLNLFLNNNQLALIDLDKVLANPTLSKSEKSRAALNRVFAKSRLNIENGLLEDLELFIENLDNRPIIEKTKNHIIIRNAPDNPCYKSLMSCYFIHNGICNNKDDIQILQSGIWLVKKNCGCQDCIDKLKNDRICELCGASLRVIRQNNQEQIVDCKQWCDRVAILSMGWCSKSFPLPHCQVICAATIYELQRGCYWCCDGEGFYKRCVEPFEDLGKYFQAPCDPLWD